MRSFLLFAFALFFQPYINAQGFIGIGVSSNYITISDSIVIKDTIFMEQTMGGNRIVYVSRLNDTFFSSGWHPCRPVYYF